jgi:hypothetical protein
MFSEDANCPFDKADMLRETRSNKRPILYKSILLLAMFREGRESVDQYRATGMQFQVLKSSVSGEGVLLFSANRWLSEVQF